MLFFVFRALHKFEDKDFVGVRDFLELIPGASLRFIIDRISGSPLSVEKEEVKSGGYTFTPLWSPQQILQASDINMMQAVTLYWTSGVAGGGTKKDEALRYHIITIPYYIIMPYHTIPYHTILYYTILYYTILYYTILYLLHHMLFYVRNEINKLLNGATELLEGVIANGTKDWPPSIPEIHTVQYYGVHILTKILSGKHEEVGFRLKMYA